MNRMPRVFLQMKRSQAKIWKRKGMEPKEPKETRANSGSGAKRRTGETSSEYGGARAETAKAGKASIGRREELVGFHASLMREAHSEMLIGGVT